MYMSYAWYSWPVAPQMEWHTGYTLSQTLYSFLHVHALRETDPELIPADQVGEVDHTRPLELVTIVLRAYVYGLLKSCDLSWRELNKGNVYDVRLMTCFYILHPHVPV
jgi:hypothetical protein